MNKAEQLCDQYRKMFFKMPIGALAWKNATPLEGTITNFRNNQISESFHFEMCIICKGHNIEPVELKQLAKMTEEEKFIYKIYLESSVPPVNKNIKLKIQKLDNSYYFKCEQCIKEKK